MKSKVHKLDIGKLWITPVDLIKLRDVVKNDVKKDVYNAKIKDIEDELPDITNVATNTTLNAKKNDVKNEIPSTTNLVTNASFNAKINEVKNKAANIPKIPITTASNAVENKILDYSKQITTPEFNKFTAENFTPRLKQANVATKDDIADFVKKTDFDDKLQKLNKKVTSNKSQHLLVQNELKKLQDKI